MIPQIEITTQNIRAKYNVSEKFAHKIIELILKEYDLELNKDNCQN